MLRKFKNCGFSIIAILIIGAMLAACAPKGTQDNTEPASTPESTQTPAGNTDGAAPEETQITQSAGNNVLKVAYQTPDILDPHFAGTTASDNATRLMYDYFVFVDEDYVPDFSRGLAESYEVDDSGTVWTFAVRQGVKFHDGKTMNSRDVKFSFDRLRDSEIGAPTASLYENIIDVSTPDDYTVVFTLEAPNPDFLLDLFDYHAKVVDADNTDFATNFNGTGPFIVDRYIPEDRMVLSRNPDYWLYDKQGVQMPYLDGVEYLFMSDENAQLEALRSGQVQYLMFLPAEMVPGLESNPDITVYRKPSNFSYVLRMRSDKGPAADNRVRQALKAGTDRSALLNGAVGGLGITGRDTPIGPAFSSYYLDVPEPARDIEKAKRLLAEAGYPDGLDIVLHTQQASPVPAVATIWKEQMAEIGVNVEIQMVPPEVYYADMWMEVDFGFTDWGPRPYPQPYLDLAYTTNAPWNESHWSNAKLDELAAEAAKEMNEERRIELYQEIQKIFIEEGPIIVPFFSENLYAARSNVKGIIPALGMSLDLRLFYFE